MRTTTTNVLLIGVLAAGLLGCGSDDDTAGTPSADPSSNTVTATSAPTSDAPPDPPASDAAATSEVTDAPALEPDFRWPLAGDGTADAGSVDLTTDGGATWSSDGLTLDGVTGYAASPEPGPIDTTKSFTVMAWVKPDGIVPFSNVASQLGEVAGAFFLGYGEYTWNFAIKPSDSNEPGVTRRIGTGIVEPVPTTWVHLAGVYDHDRGWAQLYVNGHPATPEGVDVPTPFAATGALHIGNAQAHAELSDYWRGTIADVSVHTSALDNDEIAAIVQATAPAGATLDAPPPPVEIDCPNPEGGTCLGAIPAGTYTTTTFRPSITYTVPDGWVNGEDAPGNFLLQLEGDPRYLGIYRNIAVPVECEEEIDSSVDQSVEAISNWLTSHPGLVTTEPQAVSIGGLDGVYIDISLDPAWTVTCPYSGGQPIVPFIIGGGPSSFHHVIVPGFQERLYLLKADGGNVAIEVGPEGDGLPEYLELVEPIIDSLQFTS